MTEFDINSAVAELTAKMAKRIPQWSGNEEAATELWFQAGRLTVLERLCERPDLKVLALRILDVWEGDYKFHQDHKHDDDDEGDGE